MRDSIAGTFNQLNSGDRISFVADGQEWLATVRSCEPAEDHDRWWLRLDWDDHMQDPTRWYWPQPDLALIDA